MKLGPYIHAPLGMNYNNFADPLTFAVAPPPGHKLNLSNTLVYNQTPEKLMTSVLRLVLIVNICCYLLVHQINVVNIFVIPAKHQDVSIVTMSMLASRH